MKAAFVTGDVRYGKEGVAVRRRRKWSLISTQSLKSVASSRSISSLKSLPGHLRTLFQKMRSISLRRLVLSRRSRDSRGLRLEREEGRCVEPVDSMFFDDELTTLCNFSKAGEGMKWSKSDLKRMDSEACFL